MALHIKKLSLTGFRSYSRLSLDDLGHLTILVGHNAAGKTNVIEAIQLMTSAESFRKPRWDEVVAWGSDEAYVWMVFEDGPRLVEHALSISEGKRVYEINGKRKNKNEVRGTCPSILFTPDHLQMIKSSSAARRDAIDLLGSQLSKNYSALKEDYAQSLRQRNLLIKEEIHSGALFESWDESLCINGARLGINRRRLFGRLLERMSSIYGQLVEGEELDGVYLPSWVRFDQEGRQLPDVAEIGAARFVVEEAAGDTADVDGAYRCLIDASGKRAAQELQRKTSLIGPHKDEVSLYINGRNARKYCSQGQQRTIVLAWKLAEVELVREMLGQDPVLLLDDVMSELDGERRDALTSFINKSAQTFITTTNLGYFSQELLEKAHIIELPIKD